MDGMQFVTARGWEDLSYLIYSYEALSIPVDEDIIHQFLQHEDIAKDVAAYYDLYQKYRDEYDISRILTGEVKTSIFERLFRASFDERLSCVELLTGGLHNYIAAAMGKDRITTECYEFLKEYRKGLGALTDNVSAGAADAGNSSDSESQSRTDSGSDSWQLWQQILSEKDNAFALTEKTGLVSPEDKKQHLEVMELLREWTPDTVASPKEAFGQVKAGFDKLCEQRTDAISQASKALDYSFTFMEDAFGEGQEMVIFVTELTMDSEISAFITENGCEKYFQYNKTLLVGSRRAAILKELNRDDIYSDASAYEF